VQYSLLAQALVKLTIVEDSLRKLDAETSRLLRMFCSFSLAFYYYAIFCLINLTLLVDDYFAFLYLITHTLELFTYFILYLSGKNLIIAPVNLIEIII